MYVCVKMYILYEECVCACASFQFFSFLAYKQQRFVAHVSRVWVHVQAQQLSKGCLLTVPV